MFLYLYMLVFVDYVKTIQKTKYVDWDVKTITAGDYTVEFDLTEEQYAHWQVHYYDATSLLNESQQFKIYIQS